MVGNKSNEIGKVIREQRMAIPLRLVELSALSGVSPSHLGRIEKGKRFPSGRVLRRIAQPLGFREEELLISAGYLSPESATRAEKGEEETGGRLDPYVASVLAQETPEMQRTVIAILTILKNLAKR